MSPLPHSFFADHTYSDRVTNGELLAELDARIASTPWRWAFPFNKVDALRLRLARAYLAGAKRQRLFFALAFGAGVFLFVLVSDLLLSQLGPGLERGRIHRLYSTLFMGVWFGAIGHWTITTTAASACYDIAREMDARRAAAS